MVEQFHIGQRVRLKRTLATQPKGMFRKGATGTVTHVEGIMVWIRMDQHFPHLAHWDNAMLIECSEITAETRGLWTRLKTVWRGE
jgi:hypothetical protein